MSPHSSTARVLAAAPDRTREPRPEFDAERIERAVREILAGLGEDPDREGLLETPRRVASAYREMVSGLYEDPAAHLDRVFEHHAEPEDLVVLRDIEFASICEHHLLPFHGRAHIAYLPSADKVVGLSKIARTVESHARRPQIQERLGSQIADAIQDRLDARGAIVVLESRHMCMTIRGAQKPTAEMVTTAVRGDFATDRTARAEALSLLRAR